MMLVEESSVPAAALPVAELKDHLRLGTGFTGATVQDAVLESFLRAAVAAIEARTGKILIERAFSWNVSGWRDPMAQAVPVAPVSTITELKLIDGAGSETIADPALFRLERDSQRPRIRATGSALPAVPFGGAAEMRIVAGIAGSWAGLPADLGHAVLLLAAHYYEYRNETALGKGCMPFGVTSLIERYKTVRIFAGSGA